MENSHQPPHHHHQYPSTSSSSTIPHALPAVPAPAAAASASLPSSSVMSVPGVWISHDPAQGGRAADTRGTKRVRPGDPLPSGYSTGTTPAASIVVPAPSSQAYSYPMGTSLAASNAAAAVQANTVAALAAAQGAGYGGSSSFEAPHKRARGPAGVSMATSFQPTAAASSSSSGGGAGAGAANGGDNYTDAQVAAMQDEEVPAGLIPPFLKKTYDMLQDASLSHMVCWGADGTSIVIREPVSFAETVLPRYFAHRNYGSFVRQLNIYGFRKATKNTSVREYKHPLFMRGRLANLLRMKRRARPKKSRAKSAARHASEAAAALGLGTHSRHDLDSVLSQLVTLKSRQREVEANVHNLQTANTLMRRENEQLWGELQASRQRQVKMQEKMRRLLFVLYEIYRVARGTNTLGGGSGVPMMLMDAPPIEGGASGSASAVADLSSQALVEAMDATNGTSSALSAMPGQALTLSTTAPLATHGMHTGGASGGGRAVDPHPHPFFEASGHLSPGQLHSTIQFLELHDDQDAVPTTHRLHTAASPASGPLVRQPRELPPSLAIGTAASTATSAAPSVRTMAEPTASSSSSSYSSARNSGGGAGGGAGVVVQAIATPPPSPMGFSRPQDTLVHIPYTSTATMPSSSAVTSTATTSVASSRPPPQQPTVTPTSSTSSSEHLANEAKLLAADEQAMLNRLGEWEDKLDEEVDLDVLLNDDGSETPSLLQSSGVADHVVDPAQPAHKA